MAKVAGDYALTGYLYEFGEVDGAEIVARLNFVVRLRERRTGDVLWTHVYNHDEPATEKSVPAIVVAMDKNVQKGRNRCNHLARRVFPGSSTQIKRSAHSGIASSG